VPEIQHFGVKGMRWGVRKSETQAGPRRQAKPKTKNPTEMTKKGADFAKSTVRASTPQLNNKAIKRAGKTFLVTGAIVGIPIMALNALIYKEVVWDANH